MGLTWLSCLESLQTSAWSSVKTASPSCSSAIYPSCGTFSKPLACEPSNISSIYAFFSVYAFLYWSDIEGASASTVGSTTFVLYTAITAAKDSMSLLSWSSTSLVGESLVRVPNWSSASLAVIIASSMILSNMPSANS